MANSSPLLGVAAGAAPNPTTTNLLGLLGHPYPYPFHPGPSGSDHPNGSLTFTLTTTTTNVSKAFGTSTLQDGVGEGGGGQGVAGGKVGSCHDWQDAQHTLFQLANLCVAVSFLTPSSFRFHLAFLRGLLLLAFLLFLLWASLFICMADVLGWNLVFFVTNGGHIAWLLYRHLPSRLPASHAGLYTKVFKPVAVSQAEFLDLCEKGSLQTVSKGGYYAMEGLTPCAQHVSILLKGRLKVTHQRVFLHHVEINQFVDAAEFDSMCLQHENSDKYQVSIAATEDSMMLTWDFDTLQEYMSSHPFMHTMLHYLTGKDVCSQLYAIQEQLLQAADHSKPTITSRPSSMVNVRSCLAAHDAASPRSLPRMADLTGYRPRCESQSAPAPLIAPLSTVETRV